MHRHLSHPLAVQERLATLKKEQADADTAREAAWRQLKSVVGEISRLATAAPSTPTAVS